MNRQRGPDGRWLKTDGDVPADGSGAPTVIVILPEVDDPTGLEWGSDNLASDRRLRIRRRP